MNRLVNRYVLNTFHEMKKTRARSASPQSFSKFNLPTVQYGDTTAAKSSIILVRPSPRVIRKRRISAFGMFLKLTLPVSLGPKRVSPKACVSPIAKNRRRTNHVTRRVDMRGMLASATFSNSSNAGTYGIMRSMIVSWRSWLM